MTPQEKIKAAIKDFKSIEYYEKDGYEDASESGFMLEESAAFIEDHWHTIQTALRVLEASVNEGTSDVEVIEAFDKYLESRGLSTEKRHPDEWGNTTTYKHSHVEAMFEGYCVLQNTHVCIPKAEYDAQIHIDVSERLATGDDTHSAKLLFNKVFSADSVAYKILDTAAIVATKLKEKTK